MKALLEPIKEIARFDELFRDLKKGTAGVTVISGCLESQKAHMIAGLSEDAPVRLLIAENELKAKELYELEEYKLDISRIKLNFKFDQNKNDRCINIIDLDNLKIENNDLNYYNKVMKEVTKCL